MYTAFGDYLIAIQEKTQQTSASGFIVSPENQPKYRVICTPLNYSGLKDKVVVLSDPIKAMPLPDKKHVSIHYQSIIAVEA